MCTHDPCLCLYICGILGGQASVWIGLELDSNSKVSLLSFLKLYMDDQIRFFYVFDGWVEDNYQVPRSFFSLFVGDQKI